MSYIFCTPEQCLFVSYYVRTWTSVTFARYEAPQLYLYLSVHLYLYQSIYFVHFMSEFKMNLTSGSFLLLCFVTSFTRLCDVWLSIIVMICNNHELRSVGGRPHQGRCMTAWQSWSQGNPIHPSGQWEHHHHCWHHHHWHHIHWQCQLAIFTFVIFTIDIF